MFILENTLPLRKDTFSSFSVLVCVISLSCVEVPLYTVYLKSELVSGFEGVSLILGNYLAGGKDFLLPEVRETPETGGDGGDNSVSCLCSHMLRLLKVDQLGH